MAVLVVLSLPPNPVVLLPEMVLPIARGVFLMRLPVLPRLSFATVWMVPTILIPPLLVVPRMMANLAPLLMVGVVVVVFGVVVTVIGVVVEMLNPLLTTPISLATLMRATPVTVLRTLLPEMVTAPILGRTGPTEWNWDASRLIVLGCVLL